MKNLVTIVSIFLLGFSLYCFGVYKKISIVFGSRVLRSFSLSLYFEFKWWISSPPSLVNISWQLNHVIPVYWLDADPLNVNFRGWSFGYNEIFSSTTEGWMFKSHQMHANCSVSWPPVQTIALNLTDSLNLRSVPLVSRYSALCARMFSYGITIKSKALRIRVSLLLVECTKWIYMKDKRHSLTYT